LYRPQEKTNTRTHEGKVSLFWFNTVNNLEKSANISRSFGGKSGGKFG